MHVMVWLLLLSLRRGGIAAELSRRENFAHRDAAKTLLMSSGVTVSSVLLHCQQEMEDYCLFVDRLYLPNLPFVNVRKTRELQDALRRSHDKNMPSLILIDEDTHVQWGQLKHLLSSNIWVMLMRNDSANNYDIIGRDYAKAFTTKIGIASPYIHQLFIYCSRLSAWAVFITCLEDRNTIMISYFKCITGICGFL